MPIQAGDIELVESDTMDDTAQGGGSMTTTAIIDGQSNNIFEDISTLDRVYGAVHMRKVFPRVNIQTQDKYFGSHTIITKLPKDTKIGVNLFDTDDYFDRRPDAQSRVENYRAKGGNFNGFLWSTQYKDSKIISIFQNETASQPNIGDVLYLTQASDTEFQYVKIVNTTSTLQVFNDAAGAYTRRVISVEISQTLEYDFVGADMTRSDSITPEATIKTTVIANAAKYYSARPISQIASIDDTEINVDTVYSQVIPSSLQEDAVVDENMGNGRLQFADASSATTAIVFSEALNAGNICYLGAPCLPGTLSAAVTGGTMTDKGGKVLVGTTEVGVINYEEGSITMDTDSANYGTGHTINFRHAVARKKIADTATLYVSDSNRGYVWVINLNPRPEPKSIMVSYRALGEWYNLYDNGDGAILAEEAGIGSGTIDYATGSATLTLAALPDADSVIVWAWGQKADYINRSGTTPELTTYTHQLGNIGINPGSVVVTWNDGVARTATASAGGVFSGDATGTMNHATGVLEFRPSVIPANSTIFTVDYDLKDAASSKSKTFIDPAPVAGELTLDLQETNILPDTVELTLPISVDPATYKKMTDLLPSLKQTYNVYPGDDGIGGWTLGVSGTINYTTGILTAGVAVNVDGADPVYTKEQVGTFYSRRWDGMQPVYDYVVTDFTLGTVVADYRGTGTVIVKYQIAGATTPVQETFTGTDYNIDLTGNKPETILQGSVRFTLGTKEYIDRNGSLFYDIDHTNNSATFAGTINYSTGIINLQGWVTGTDASTIIVKSMATAVNAHPVTTMIVRIPNSPIKSQSFSVRATQVDGAGEVTATSDVNGIVSAAGIDGFINYDTGVAELRFGDWITAAGNESEPWYDADAVVNGEIFKPDNVHSDTVFYNAVSQTFLPLDASVLGLNPVRLPQDGRIPIYEPADVVVVLNDQTTSGTFTSSTQTDLGRVRLSKVTIKDAGNLDLDTTKYSVDLDLGLIDWGDLTGVSQPLTITDRIEDMVLVTDVQITGKLSLSQPLTHDFPVANTLVSNAVIHSDMFAHTSIPFDQQTWTGVWSDILIGSEVSAEYNHVLYPIQVDNSNCIEERWYAYFATMTTVNIVGENTGQIVTGATIGAPIAPINPNTSQPYFTIPAEGWGGGWSAGNILRFNTYAANVPVWIIQSVAQGEATDPDFNFCIEVRGDIDTP